MNTITGYLKAHVALVLAVTTWLVTALKDGQISGQEWVGLPIAVLTGLGVAVVANKPAKVHAQHVHIGGKLKKDGGYGEIDGLIRLVGILLVLGFVAWLIVFLVDNAH